MCWNNNSDEVGFASAQVRAHIPGAVLFVEP